MNSSTKITEPTILQSITTVTPDGDFHIIIDQDGTARASGFGTINDLVDRLPIQFRDLPVHVVNDHVYAKLVQAYYAGDATALNQIPREQIGTDFQHKVWQAMSRIPFGNTLSYKELAIAAGNPLAVRAAGTTCGLNRLILLIPCHRILRSDGSVGSYLYGTSIKRSLLSRELVQSGGTA